jgi:hypothetical protein
MSEFKIEEDKRCGVCGGRLVTVRPRTPRGPTRTVCPTCMADRLDQIHDISAWTYGLASAAEGGGRDDEA